MSTDLIVAKADLLNLERIMEDVPTKAIFLTASSYHIKIQELY